MANTGVFFRPAEGFVKDELTGREWIYGANVRAGFYDKEDHASFLAGKTAYGRLIFEGDVTVGFERKGGFESMYETSNSDSIIPRAILDNIKVHNAGQMGAYLQAEASFKVFSLAHLEYYEDKLIGIGKDCQMVWGWSVDGRAGENEQANKGEFSGKISNFSYSLTEDGGFVCNVKAIGQGYRILGGNPNTMGKDSSTNEEDATGNNKQEYVGIAKQVKARRIELKESLKTHASYDDGFAIFEMLLVVVNTDEEEDENENGKPTRDYVTLEKLIELINTNVGEGAKFVCDSETTRGYTDKWIKSPAIQHIIFPGAGQGDYTDGALEEMVNSNPNDKVKEELNNQFKANKESFESKEELTDDDLRFEVKDIAFDLGDGKCDLSKTLIAIDTIQAIVDAGNERAQESDTDNPYVFDTKAFLTAICKLIKKASGGIYNLILWNEGDKVMLINNNFHEPLDRNLIIEFKPFSPYTIVRSMNLSATVPPEFQQAAYGANANAKQVDSEVTKKQAEVLTTAKAEEKSEEPEEDPLQSANALIPILWGFYKNTRSDIEIDELNPTYRFAAGQKTCASAMTSYKIYGDVKQVKWNNNIMIPLNFSVTMDGINGFRFGDTVTCDYLPSKYKDPDADGYLTVFTVSKVSHNISQNDWQTSLETICRLNASS
jgi:hypothetical protein